MKLFVPSAVAVMALLSANSVFAEKNKCTVTYIAGLAPQGTVVSSAEPTAKPVPHCLIDGFIITQNPGPNRVNFKLQLPDSGWNNRYYMIGLGGSAGYVPSDSQVPGGNPLVKGFAVAGNDTGHTGFSLDWSFIVDPAQSLDYSHRGTHVTAVATQQITKKYYNADTMYRYISGCSGGGRMGVMSAEHHPEDFDGHLIGAPGRSTAVMLKDIWTLQQMTREAGAWVSPQKLAMVDTAVTAACDMSDGAKDNLVWDAAQCDFDIASLECKLDQHGNCLTAPELTTIAQILRGPHGPDGEQITGGMPITNMGMGWPAFVGVTPPPWKYALNVEQLATSPAGFIIANVISKAYFGQDYDFLTDFDFNNQAHLDAWWAAAKRTGFSLPHRADVKALEALKHKIIWWHGVSDAGPTLDTSVGYYDDALKSVNHDPKRLSETYTLYRIPGMLHCSGGLGPDDAPDRLLEKLIQWVEMGEKPADVVVHRGEGTFEPIFIPPEQLVSGVELSHSVGESREFKLCPYPQVSTFNGDVGGELKAANWTCK